MHFSSTSLIKQPHVQKQEVISETTLVYGVITMGQETSGQAEWTSQYYTCHFLLVVQDQGCCVQVWTQV